MSELATLTPPAAPRTNPAANVMGFQMERRAQATSVAAAVREAARSAPPRAALRLAHEERTAAAADISRFTDALARAREHRDAMAARRSDAEARARHIDAEAAEGLIVAFSSGATATVAPEGFSKGDDDAAAKAAKLAREAEIAEAAADRLSAELVDAQERARVAGWRVRALALATIEAHGEELAQAMLIEQEAMRRRRARLSDLQTLLTNEWRAICGDAVSPPNVMSAAATAADPPPAWKPSSPYVPRQAEPPNRWGRSFQALLDDAEAEIEAAA